MVKYPIMDTLNFQKELQNIIESKQLIEVDLPADKGVVAYVLRASDDFITIAEVSASMTLLAVSMYRLSDVELIRVDSIYLSKLVKQLPDDSLYQKATQIIEKMQGCSFDSFFETFAGKETLVELLKENGESLQGKIVNYSDTMITFEEYYTQYDSRFSRTFVSRNIINCIAIGTPRLRILEAEVP